jgi:hypothetical protein
MHAHLLLSVFDTLDKAGIVYCLLRDGERLDQPAGLGEVDLLVQRDQFKQLSGVLSQHGFANLLSWGHVPHHFFIGYDTNSDTWHKLDVVTEVAYGFPSHALRTKLGGGCLARRRRLDPIYIPSAEDEFVTLLLHCALDKGRFEPNRRLRLQALCNEIVDEDYLDSLLKEYWSPNASWRKIRDAVLEGDWTSLISDGNEAADFLAARDPLGTASRRVRDKLLRKLNRWGRRWHPRALMVAFLAPDGAGKSTVVSGIQRSFYFPVSPVYMGLYQKDGSPKKQAPVPGIGFLRRMLTQWGRYLAARFYQFQGRLVVFDRYSYDALLPSHKPLNLPRRMRRWLLARACPAPDMVIVLDAPGELLFERKGEHSANLLEAQRQGYLKLRHVVPRVVVVDATKSADLVRREVTGLIWRGYTARNEVAQ